MKLNVKQTVYDENTAVFKEGDTVKLTTTDGEKIGRVTGIETSGSRRTIKLDSSTEYNSLFNNVDLSVITEVEVL